MVSQVLERPRARESAPAGKANYATLKALVSEAGLLKSQGTYYAVKLAYTLAMFAVATQLRHFGQPPEVIAIVTPFFLLFAASLTSVLVYLALRPPQWWENIVVTCSNTMVFFASPEHRDASDLCAPPDQAASLTPDQVHVLSGPIYSGKFDLDYARPSRDQLLAHFASMSLTGDYWQI